MDKKILIGGGVAAAVLVILVVKHKGQSAPADSADTGASSDIGFFSGMTPMGTGMSSSDGGGNFAASDPANSGSTEVGGGFDLGAMMSSMFGLQAKNTDLQIRTGGNVAESAILAGINFGQFGGSATVNHTGTGTTFNVTPGGDSYDMIVSSAYQATLGRAPDAGGLSFFKNAIMNSGLSLSGLTNNLMSSPEYASLHPSSPLTQAPPTPQPAPVTAPPVQYNAVEPQPTPTQVTTSPTTKVYSNYKTSMYNMAEA